MTAPSDEAALRRWLVDYLARVIGRAPEDIDVDASTSDLGVSSRDAIALSGELAELVGRPISPVEFWQHPSINSLARFLSAPALDDHVERQAAAPGPAPAHDPIAVVGLGCRFPGDIRGPDALWRFLAEGRCAVTEVPADRWLAYDDGSAGVAAALSGTTRWGGYLTDIDAFDAEFFDIGPREAVKMDPQQRLLLEVAWEALEHAGIPAQSLRRSPTGVFIGACVSEYAQLGFADVQDVDAWTNTGGALSIIANRLSYFLDLRGPSITVDTACSSSLVAVHLACQSLRMQESELAVVGGVNLLLSPAIIRGFDSAGMMSPTGRCHSFDARADGFVRGEGCGVVVLKRLTDAVRDGNRVLAVIRGSAVNQDGHSNGLTAPNPSAQVAVLREAYANAGIASDAVDYVEAHGTGTVLGDPIEARALGTVLGRGRPADTPLLIGAIKSNLGHLEAAAGIAGLLKTVLAVQRGVIPANLSFENPNPHIKFDQLRLRVVAANVDWPQVNRARRAGVSSFGFGGTNAHVVVEQAPTVPARPGDETPAITTMVVTGKTPERIATLAGTLVDWMQADGADVAPAEVAHTLNHHRASHPMFATVCGRDRPQLLAGLRALAAGRLADGVVGPHVGPCGPGTVFVYSGQGSQWAGMGRRLLADEPAFARTVDGLEPAFIEHTGFSLRRALEDAQPVTGDARVQPVLFGLQLGLTELWRDHGVHPDAVIGHSMGEVAAAVVAGALTVADGLRVITTRSRLMSGLAGQGAVALLRLSAEATADLLADHPEVTLAVSASPTQTVVAGPVAQVEAVIDEATRRDRFARRVNMEVASHTALMDPILPELRSALSDITAKTPVLDFHSTVIDSAAPIVDADYWVANLRRPVRLQDAVVAAAANHTTFVEISPHPTLAQAVAETLEPIGHYHSVGTLLRDSDDTVAFHTNFNAVHTGRPPHTPHPSEPHPVLPATPWQASRFWLHTTRRAQSSRGSTAQSTGLIPPEWYSELSWVRRPSPAAQPHDEDAWLVVAAADLGREIADALGADSRVTVLPPSDLAGRAGEAALADAVTGASHILYAPDLATGTFDAAPAHAVFNTARGLLAAAGKTSRTRLHFLTRNAQPIAEGDRANPGHAVLWGLGRTLALEQPDVWGAVIDVDASVPPELAARYVTAEVYDTGGEDQVVYRAGVRYVPRLHRTTAPSATDAGFQGSQLVIGATGNIGPHLINRLAEEGAGTIVAVSRNPGSRLDELAETLAARGVSLVTVAADVSDETAMSALFDRFGADLPPLDGLYLAAFGGAPATLDDMTDADVAAMFGPKLDAASLLHRLSLRTPIRRFVLFSSISGLVGSRWLAHYAATTTFLDTFAYARRAAGLPATSINWGWWKSLADSQSDQERRVTLDSGLRPMPDGQAIAALGPVSAPGGPVRCAVVAADWTRLATAYRTRAALRIVDDLLPGDGADDAGTGEAAGGATLFRERLRGTEPAHRRDLLTAHVSGLVAALLGLASPQAFDPATGFFQLGMDSLMSVTLQRTLSEHLGEVLPASVVFDYPTVHALSGYLATVLPELADGTADPGVADAQDAHLYDELTEDELLRELSERLN